MSRNIKLLLSASIFIHSGANLLAPVFAIFLVQIDGTLLETGLAVGIYTILRGVFYLLFSRMKESVISRKVMMTIGYAIMGIVYVLYIGVENVRQLFVLQGVLSFGEAMIMPSWSATIALCLTAGREREIYSRFYGYRSLFEGAAAIAGGFLCYDTGIRDGVLDHVGLRFRRCRADAVCPSGRATTASLKADKPTTTSGSFARSV